MNTFDERFPTDDWTMGETAAPDQYNRPFGELKPADVPPSQRALWATQDVLMGAGADPYNAGKLADISHTIAGFTPAGAAISGADLPYHLARGDYGHAALDALGMAPGVGPLVRGARALGPVGRAAVGAGAAGAALLAPDDAQAGFIKSLITKLNPNLLEETLSSVKQRIPLADIQSGLRFRSDMPAPTYSKPEDLVKGGTLLSLHGDRSNLGWLEQSLGVDLTGEHHIPGGMGFIAKQSPTGSVWASEPSVASVYQNRIAGAQQASGGKPVYGAYGPMGVQSIDFQPAVSKAALTEVERTKPNIAPAAFEAFDERMRRQWGGPTPEKPNKKVDWVAVPDWPGIANTGAAETFLADATGGVRNKFGKMLDRSDMMNAGMPNMSALRYGFTNPDVANLPNYTYGRGMAELSAAPAPAGFEHPAFGKNIAGRDIGGWGYAAPREVVFPDVVKKLKAEGYPASQWDFYFGGRMPQQVPYQQSITSRWIDANSQYRALVQQMGETAALDKFAREGLKF